LTCFSFRDHALKPLSKQTHQSSDPSMHSKLILAFVLPILVIIGLAGFVLLRGTGSQVDPEPQDTALVAPPPRLPNLPDREGPSCIEANDRAYIYNPGFEERTCFVVGSPRNTNEPDVDVSNTLGRQVQVFVTGAIGTLRTGPQDDLVVLDAPDAAARYPAIENAGGNDEIVFLTYGLNDVRFEDIGNGRNMLIRDKASGARVLIIEEQFYWALTGDENSRDARVVALHFTDETLRGEEIMAKYRADNPGQTRDYPRPMFPVSQ